LSLLNGDQYVCAEEIMQSTKLHLVKAEHEIDAKAIVRETLVIARECGQILAVIECPTDQLLVELVASLAVVRARKAGE
jgi:hypothetical protein